MKKTVAAIAALALVAGQASVASASVSKADTKIAAAPSCAAPVKVKSAKVARVENRCAAADASDRGIAGVGVVPLVFAGAIVAGVVAVAVVTTSNNSSTSP